MTYCEAHGIAPHRFKPDAKALLAWNPLLGFHRLCRECGHAALYIGHDKSERQARIEAMTRKATA